MNTYIFQDDKNYYPICQVDWAGPGYYTSHANGEVFQVFQVEPASYDGPWPSVEGYGTTVFCENITDAAYGKLIKVVAGTDLHGNDSEAAKVRALAYGTEVWVRGSCPTEWASGDNAPAGEGWQMGGGDASGLFLKAAVLCHNERWGEPDYSFVPVRDELVMKHANWPHRFMYHHEPLTMEEAWGEFWKEIK